MNYKIKLIKGLLIVLLGIIFINIPFFNSDNHPDTGRTTIDTNIDLESTPRSIWDYITLIPDLFNQLEKELDDLGVN